jgi:hypothetical protein
MVTPFAAERTLLPDGEALPDSAKERILQKLEAS